MRAIVVGERQVRVVEGTSLTVLVDWKSSALHGLAQLVGVQPC